MILERVTGEIGAAWIEQRDDLSVLPIILRTRYFDDFLQQIIFSETIQQVVLLGASLDTRAYRLTWTEDTRFFELDQPDILDYKEKLLADLGAGPGCQRYTIGVDLTCPWMRPLTQAGFDPHTPTVWLLEGFLFYLPNENITQLIDQVTELSIAGSWMGFDIINQIMLTHPLTRNWVDMQAVSGAPWIGTMDDPIDFLGVRGWQANLSQAGASDANYGRWPYPVIPVTLPEAPHNWYVTAWKKERSDQS